MNPRRIGRGLLVFALLWIFILVWTISFPILCIWDWIRPIDVDKEKMHYHSWEDHDDDHFGNLEKYLHEPAD